MDENFLSLQLHPGREVHPIWTSNSTISPLDAGMGFVLYAQQDVLGE